MTPKQLFIKMKRCIRGGDQEDPFSRPKSCTPFRGGASTQELPRRCQDTVISIEVSESFRVGSSPPPPQ